MSYSAKELVVKYGNLMPRWLKEVILRDLGKVTQRYNLSVEEMYKCGWFGCTFKARLRRIFDWGDFILKITADQTEGPNQILIGQEQARARGKKIRCDYFENDPSSLFRLGFTIVEAVAKTDPVWIEHEEVHGEKPVYIIIREEIRLVRTDLHEPVYSYSSSSSPESFFSSEEIRKLDLALANYREHAQFIQHRMKQQHRRVDVDFEIENNLRDKVAIYSDSLAAGLLGFFMRTGRPLADAHGGNIGVRYQKGMVNVQQPNLGVGDLIIFDPGFTHIPKAPKAKKLNP